MVCENMKKEKIRKSASELKNDKKVICHGR